MKKKKNNFFKQKTLNLIAEEYGFERRTTNNTWCEAEEHECLQRDILLFHGTCCVCPYLVSITIEKMPESEGKLGVSSHIKSDLFDGLPMLYFARTVDVPKVFDLCSTIEEAVTIAEVTLRLKRSAKLSKFDDDLDGAE